MLAFTDRAVAALARSDAAARRFDPDVRIRLDRDPSGGIRSGLADRPAEGDDVIEHGAGFTVFVEPDLSGVVDVAEPHDRLVLLTDPG